MTQQFTSSEVRKLLRESLVPHDLPIAEVFNAYADHLEADEKAVPVAYALFTEKGLIRMWSREWFADAHGAPVNPTPLYAHPVPSDAGKRDTMTPRELAKRIERGEKWKLADEPTPCQSRDAERLAEALERTARHRAAADRIDPDQWRSVLYSWEDRALAAHSAQAQPELDGVQENSNG